MKYGAGALAETSLMLRNISLRNFYADLSRGEMKDRAPLFVAILSVAIQHYDNWGRTEFLQAFLPAYSIVLFCLVVLSALLCLFERTNRIGIILFIAIVAVNFVPRWTSLANHTFLALWTVPLAVLFREWWKSELYSQYLRITLAIVMFAAAAQKLLAGTYIDGSYIYWLGSNGTLTERMFSFTCDSSTGVPCIYVKIISNFILLWQIIVGVLLLWGVRSVLFLAIEIGFLLGAGLFADEMNFQVLNIALLCIVFRVGMPIWLLGTCLALLVIDAFTISYLVQQLIPLVLHAG
jgi:hypothetical protein